MIERNITGKLQYLATKFPVVTLTGARQCGKSTLLKSCFPAYRYVTLEDLDIRRQAIEDPRGFLDNFGMKTIIDEAQYAPDLFSYIQTKVDAENKTGMYFLSGSQNFLLMQSITQSLAGRTALLKLAPFSVSELKRVSLLPTSLNDWLFTGGYPRIYDKDIFPADFYPNYIQTYVERDVRQLREINNLSQFVRFLKLCAARVGQLLNINSLANECGITVPTVNAWLSVLETGSIIFLLKPYYKNYNKRLIKSPKLYFHDTGLAASLLGLENSQQLSTHYLRGELFENMVIVEYLKKEFAKGKDPQIYFWRDSNQNEVDLLVETGTTLQAIEIKSGATLNNNYFKGLAHFQQISDIDKDNLMVVYGGDADYSATNGRFISWKNWGEFVQ
ncbi:MAG: ATP-binding protein [Candidatus Azobacteroides sp.]|nr:ATP-binding protein [Candidatus Azobacteroides sp.]